MVVFRELCVVSNDLIDVIREEGARQYPNEACGVVISVGKRSVAIPCGNIATDPHLHFLMNPVDYSAAADRGEVIGIWHTHIEISNRASMADLAGCENSELPWYIVSVMKRSDEFMFSDANVISPSGVEFPYVERIYVYGIFDCFTLMRDYYRREFQIKINDRPRTERFWLDGSNVLGDNWIDEGFVKLINQEPAIGDVFLMQTDNTGNPSHIGIYIGNEMMLHHCRGRLSRRDIYGGYWLKHTTLHLRHKTKC